MPTLTCTTWNIHRAVGRDGRFDPRRVMDAIETVIVPRAPDILALQEADTECPPHKSILDVARLSAMTGLRYQHPEPRLRWGPESDGFLGTILWVHPRFTPAHADVVDLPGHCHRGVVAVEFQTAEVPFRVISGHFSLTQVLRVAQMRIVGQYLRRRPDMPTILLGDFNEWRPWGGIAFAKRLVGRRFVGPAKASFPAHRPLLPLDRIMIDRAGAIGEVEVVNADATNLASDHRPVIASVALTAGTADGDETKL